MTSPNATKNLTPKLSPGRLANLVATALVLCLGPVLIVVGSLLMNADEELIRTGERTAGTIVDFDDVSKASQRDIKVEFRTADGLVHVTSAAVDHDQHPLVGEEVTVVYQESDPARAAVLGFESDGVFLRGAGFLLTFLFGGISVFAFISYLLGRRKKRKKRAG